MDKVLSWIAVDHEKDRNLDGTTKKKTRMPLEKQKLVVNVDKERRKEIRRIKNQY